MCRRGSTSRCSGVTGAMSKSATASGLAATIRVAGIVQNGQAAAALTQPRSDIGIDMGFGARSGVGDGALFGRTHGLRVTPQRPRLEVVTARLPSAPTLGQFGLGERHFQRSG